MAKLNSWKTSAKDVCTSVSIVSIMNKVRQQFLSRNKFIVWQYNVHVALEDTLYHDWKNSRRCNRCIFSLTIFHEYSAMHFIILSAGKMHGTAGCLHSIYCKSTIGLSLHNRLLQLTLPPPPPPQGFFAMTF